MEIEHVLYGTQVDHGYIWWKGKKENDKYKQVFPVGEFTIDLEGKKISGKKVDWNMARVSIGRRPMQELFQKDDTVIISKSPNGTVAVRKKGTMIPPPPELPLVKKLREAQRNSEDPTVFEKVLVEAFNTLGFSARHIGGPNEPDILLKIPNYKVVVNAKSTKEGVISNARFDADERDKDNYNADCLAYVGPGFSEGYMRETAEKRGFILIETEAICKILQNRELYDPDRIVEILFKSGKHLITPEDIKPSSTVEDLIKIIANIMPILKNFEKAGKALFSKDTMHTVLIAQGNIFAINDIENALKFLSTTPFSILQKQNDEYSLTSDFESIEKNIRILRQAFDEMGGGL